MKHSRSSAETEIRDAVVKRFRELWPDARIIHEMNVEHGSSRADVVAVQRDAIWIAEIKSERDSLDRIFGQISDFAPSCHGLIVAAHEKWTRQEMIEVPPRINKAGRLVGGYQTMAPSLLMAATTNCPEFETWTYPVPEALGFREWDKPYRKRVPWYHRMLMLLWSDELRAVAAQHRIPCDRRTPAYKLAPEMSRLMTGREIERAVCQMLRARNFAEADAPIPFEAPAPVQEAFL